MESTLNKYKITKEAITFLCDCTGLKESNIVEWLEERWGFATTFKPFVRGYSNFENKMLFNSATGGVEDSVLGKYMMFEKADYQTFINHYLDYGWRNQICLQGVVFNSPEEACKVYKLDVTHILGIANKTNLPVREIIVAMAIYGKNVVVQEDKRKRQLLMEQAQREHAYKSQQEALKREEAKKAAEVDKQKQKVIDVPVGTQEVVNKKPKGIVYNNKRYNNYEELITTHMLGKTVLIIDLDRGMTLEQAVNRQLNLRHQNNKKTHNSMRIENVFYSNLKLVCQAFDIDNTEVSYHKSKEKCMAYNSVIYHVKKKYGQDIFSRMPEVKG